jgi:hypothetical protein
VGGAGVTGHSKKANGVFGSLKKGGESGISGSHKKKKPPTSITW